MIIHEITEECFKKYGKVIDSIDLTGQHNADSRNSCRCGL